MNSALMFSSKSDEWETPQDFFCALDAEFDFNLDVAATAENTKCQFYYSAERSALTAQWSKVFDGQGLFDGMSVCAWMNPPYSRGLQGKFIAKAAEERRKGVLTVALLPARTDTKAFHTHIYDASKWQPREGIEIRLLAGRLKFGGATNSAPFPSMIIVFRPSGSSG